MTWMLPEIVPGPSAPLVELEQWPVPLDRLNAEPTTGRIGLKIASPIGGRRYEMDAKRKKKQILRRMILGALMQSPLYFSVPLVERRLLFKRICESYNGR